MLSKFTARSLIVLGDVAAPDEVALAFREFTDAHFPAVKTHVLVKRLSLMLRLLMKASGRKEAPYNLLLRIDLDAELEEGQKKALERFRQDVCQPPGRVLIFQAENFQFHNLGSASSDQAMAFVNTWPADRSREAAQKYWSAYHGPLVQKVGLPSVITSYTQIHFDGSLDQTYQGLSFETITSQRDLIKSFLLTPSLRKLNKVLIKDERNFTGAPLFFAFREIPG